MKKSTYWYSLILSCLVLMITAGCDSQGQFQSEWPNIVIILADDLGYGDISAYNDQSKIKTPNVDRLAAEGLLFTDAHSPSSVCTPTRYGLLTGRYSWRSRLKSSVLTGKSKALIPDSRTTVASLLQSKGYHTGFIGKWHLGWDWGMKNEEDHTGEGWNEEDFVNIDFTQPVKNTPNDLGFAYSYGHSGSLDMAPYVYVENGRVTAIPDTVTVNTGKYSWWRKGPTSPDFDHEDVTPNFFRRAMQYVRDQSKEEHPFFLYLALPSPHTPILPTKDWQGKSDLNDYGDFVLMVDAYVGQLLSVIEETGVGENTLVIFSSDNGCSPAAGFDELVNMGHHPSSIYRGHKADIYEGGHRVPFLAKWPKRIEPGLISDETICLTDLLATFAQLTDYELSHSEGEDSYSLMPIFNNQTLSVPLRPATIHHSINGSFAIRKDNWKLILCPGSGGWSYPTPRDTAVLDTLPNVQLYDLSSDPGERINVESKFPQQRGRTESITDKNHY